jgi:hypothetical protein
MAIPESQLETWSHQGSVTQSAATYESIRKVLDDSDAPYSHKSFSTFLQGSYGNDTNVFRDSDVDIVMRLDSTFQFDLGDMGEANKAAFHDAYANVEYGYDEFKAHVLAWLIKKYGSDVDPGTKAITIKARNGRREADVLPCLRFRRYTRFISQQDQSYAEGICFYRTDGTKIVNFPKQHSENCTTKHQDTSSRFKPTVRVFKNLRNRMIDDKVIKDGLAPSYFIEGMLWNVPNSNFTASHQDTFVNCIKWLQQADRKQLACANDLHWLLRDNQPVCWNAADFESFLSAVIDYWNAW